MAKWFLLIFGLCVLLLQTHARGESAFELSLTPSTNQSTEQSTEPSTEPEAPATQPTTSENAEPRSLFKDPTDGAFDISGFLSTRAGFLPLAVPITEPAVGFGLGIGLTFFHDKPLTVPGADGGPSRLIMPSTTVVFGAATENGTVAAGVGHLGVWDQGRIRYVGAIGYAALNLNWYGKGDLFGGQSIAYTNDVAFTFQRLTFQLGDSNFFIGPQFQFMDTDSSFHFTDIENDIPHRDFASKNSGLGIDLSYDSLDQPFSPTHGIRAEIAYWQFADWLGGDFNYGQVQAYGITYIPLGGPFVLGLHLDGTFNIGDAPFYALPSLNTRGIPTGRYADNNEVLAEAELRYDLTKRWTLVGFGGVGRIGDSVGDLLDTDNHFAGGAGFRYLIASEYGLRIGLDVAHADADWSIYVTVGTGWARP